MRRKIMNNNVKNIKNHINYNKECESKTITKHNTHEL